MVFSQYKGMAISGGALGTIFLGASGFPLKKMETVLNEQAAEGWQLVFQVVESRRLWLFWARETVIVTLGK